MYREGAGDGVTRYVYLMNKVGRIAATYERAAGVDVILPVV